MLNILALLMAKAVASTQEVLKKLYEAHVGIVHYVVKQFRLPHEEVEDIVQETFLKVHQMQTPIEAETARALLTTIARNKALDVLRKKKRQRTEAVAEDLDNGSESLWRNNPRRVLEAQVVEEFFDEVKDEPGAEVLLLFYRDGLSIREIAERSKEPMGTVTSRLSRARSRFTELLRMRLDALLLDEET